MIFLKLNVRTHIDMKLCIKVKVSILVQFPSVILLSDTFCPIFIVFPAIYAPIFVIFDPWTKHKKERIYVL